MIYRCIHSEAGVMNCGVTCMIGNIQRKSWEGKIVGYAEFLFLLGI